MKRRKSSAPPPSRIDPPKVHDQAPAVEVRPDDVPDVPDRGDPAGLGCAGPVL